MTAAWRVGVHVLATVIQYGLDNGARETAYTETFLKATGPGLYVPGSR